MKKYPITVLLGIIVSIAFAQEPSMVGTPTMLDQTSYFARMAHLRTKSAGFELNNRFVKELNVMRFSGAIPFSSGVCSGMYQTYGFGDYREHTFSVGLAKNITPRWALGLQTRPTFETFGKAYPSRFSMDLNASAFAKLSANLYADTELHIPVRVSSNTRENAPLQSFLRMNLSYVFSKYGQTSLSVKQQLPYKTEVAMQLCYTPLYPLTIFGNAGSSSDCGFGIQYVFNRITCRFQTQYRPIVGYSTTIGIHYQHSEFTKKTSYDM